MKYINADTVIQTLRETIDRHKDSEMFTRTVRAAENIIRIIDRMPSADVVEVKHGTWTEEYKEEEAPLFRWRWVCSACGDWNGYGKSKFCPNCGADMRERKEDED